METIRKRKFPIVGDGSGMWSLRPHRRRGRGDRRRGRDGRARASTTWWTTSRRRCAEWLPAAGAAAAVPSRRGACPAGWGGSRRVEAATIMMTEIRGASNAKAKRELGWRPRYASWRQGFARGARLSDAGGAASRSCGRGVRDRLPDARQRERGGGRGPGGLPPPPPRAGRPASGSSRRAAYLSTVVTRLGIDELRSARARRETYVGEWLPEPLVTSEEADPARHAEVADSLSLAFLRAAREPLAGAARRVPAARGVRLPVRPDRGDRRQERGQRPPARGAGPPHVDERRSRFERLARAARRARRAVLRRRPGGRPRRRSRRCSPRTSSSTATAAARRPRSRGPVHGRDRVARTLRGLVAGGRALRRDRRAPRGGERPARARCSSTREGRVISVMALDIADGRIAGRASVVNPDKLRHLGPVADINSVLSTRRD